MYHLDRTFYHHQILKTKKLIKVASQYILNVFLLFNKFFFPNLYFEINIDQKRCTFKNLQKISKKQVATLYNGFS